MDRLDITMKRRGKRYLIYPVVERIADVVGRRKSRPEVERPVGI